MTKVHAKPQMAQGAASQGAAADTRIGVAVGSVPSVPADDAPPDVAQQRQNVRDFIRAMSAELSVMAHKNGLEELALIFETAREKADAETAAAKTDKSRRGNN